MPERTTPLSDIEKKLDALLKRLEDGEDWESVDEDLMELQQTELDNYHVDTYDEYASSDEADPPKGKGIFAANWNEERKWDPAGQTSEVIDETLAKLAVLLDRLGHSVEWSENYTSCEGCQRAIRTEMNSYAWIPDFWEGSGCGIYCATCVAIDPEEYIDWLSGNSKHANTLSTVKLDDHGWKVITDVDGDPLTFENGWYGGQTADPEAIANTLKAAGFDRFIFDVTDKGQFDVTWVVYALSGEVGLLARVLREGKTDSDEDPVDVMKAALESVPHESDDPDHPITVNEVGESGVVVTRKLTPQEFVEGTWR